MNIPQAIAGSTAERKAAWDALSHEQQAGIKSRLHDTMENAKAEHAKSAASAKNSLNASNDLTADLSFVSDLGFQNTISANGKNADSKNLFAESGTTFDSHTNSRVQSRPVEPIDPCEECDPPPTPTPLPTPEPTPTLTPTPTTTPTPTPTPTPTGCPDADVDGLDDCFEANLADGFTPYYHVSAGENYGTGFSLFYDSPTQEISQTFGSTPPISHYRVKPLRYEYGTDGVLYGLIQIDYLTLWNKDDGLNIGSLCSTLLPVIGISLDGLGPHRFDNERSATLVAAPVVNNSFNPDISAYNAYEFFTAAHEDTPLVDQSLLFYPNYPVSFGLHINLGLSKAKHSTYPFNPNYKPIIQDDVIYLTYAGIDFAYLYGEIDYESYLAYLYIADIVFFTCAVEHFNEQGGIYSGTRINVGDVSNPINGSSFIQSTQLSNKFQKQF